jgi:DNA-binding transcriptional regulator YdaS (Cro superfamily)
MNEIIPLDLTNTACIITSMKPQDYIKNFSRFERQAELKRLAKELNICSSYVAHMCNGTRMVNPKYVIAWEKATNGLVRKEDICPQLYPDSSKNRDTDHFAFNDSLHQM